MRAVAGLLAWITFEIVRGVLPVIALRAIDQTRINNIEENPAIPSESFLQAAKHPRTLVVVSDAAKLAQHSLLLGRLRESGHGVKVYTLADPLPDFVFKKGGDYRFDTVIVIGDKLPTSKVNEQINAKVLLEFLDDEWLLPRDSPESRDGSVLPHSVVLMAGDCSSATDGVCRADSTFGSLVNHFGFKFPEEKISLQLDGNTGFGDIKLADRPSIVSNIPDASTLAFNGFAHHVADDNPTVFSVMETNRGSAVPGGRPALISGWQGARSWSRMVVAGSSTVCSDAALSNSPSQNLLCTGLIDWASHRRGILAWSNLRHFKIEAPKFFDVESEGRARLTAALFHADALKITTPYLYKVLDEIYFGLDLFTLESSGAASNSFRWVPLVTPVAQLEFTMMSPHIRDFLMPLSGPSEGFASPLLKALTEDAPVRSLFNVTKATHAMHFVAPHNHGVFKAVVRSFGNPGYTPLWIETVMPLRNFKHNDYERFLTCAHPYYAALIVTLCSTIVFAVAFLYATPTKKEAKAKVA